MRILRVCELGTSLSTDSNFVCIKVMYIPAVPLTPQNLEYIQRQKDSFLNGAVPPDFPKGAGEAESLDNGDPVVCLLPTRDFRRACAEDGRPICPPVLEAGDAKSSGGSDALQDLPSNSAVSWQRVIRM